MKSVLFIIVFFGVACCKIQGQIILSDTVRVEQAYLINDNIFPFSPELENLRREFQRTQENTFMRSSRSDADVASDKFDIYLKKLNRALVTYKNDSEKKGIIESEIKRLKKVNY